MLNVFVSVSHTLSEPYSLLRAAVIQWRWTHQSWGCSLTIEERSLLYLHVIVPSLHKKENEEESNLKFAF